MIYIQDSHLSAIIIFGLYYARRVSVSFPTLTVTLQNPLVGLALEKSIFNFHSSFPLATAIKGRGEWKDVNLGTNIYKPGLKTQVGVGGTQGTDRCKRLLLPIGGVRAILRGSKAHSLECFWK